jgi:hypothetical protein
MTDPTSYAAGIEAAARVEARALAERAGIDMMDDHDQFIDDLSETLVRFRALAPERGGGSDWLPIESVPKEGYFLAWSPDFPDLVTPFRADLFASMRQPRTPKHLSAHHYTLWRPMASVLP